MILPVFFILLCMKTALSEKMAILLDRTMAAAGLTKENIEDRDDDDGKDSKKKNNKPVGGGGAIDPGVTFLPPPQSTMDYRGTGAAMPPQPQMMYDSMAAAGEPMAANEFGGGGFMSF
jgi:hypothetical protein